MPTCAKCNWNIKEPNDMKIVNAVYVYHRLCWEQKQREDSQPNDSGEDK